MTDNSDSEQEALINLIEVCADSENEKESNDQVDQIEKFKKKFPKKRKRFENQKEVENEKDLNNFLFGNKEDLIQNLESKKAFFLDTSENADKEENEAAGSAAWHDSDDDEFFELNGKIARIKQKKKMTRIGNTQKWANLDKEKNLDASESDEDDVLTKSVGFLDKNVSKKTFITKGEITFKRLKNLNRTTENEGIISSIQFHPKSFVGIVAGRKGLVSIFAVDGRENKKIHNICYEKFPIYSCKLTNDGEELIVGGQLRDFHIYNLMSGFKQRIKLPQGMRHMKQFEMSTCGKYIAVIGDYGEVHLLHAITKELLFTYKQEYQSTALSFSRNSNDLYSHSDDNEVTIFDIRTQRVRHRFIDEGCVNGTVLTLSQNGKFLATGSRQGYVNIYDCESVAKSKYPKSLKVISNLKTEISDIKFNHTSELLAICSVDDNDALKLIHVESGSVYSNFPSNLDNIGNINLLTFSPESGYLGVGTTSSKVPLYRLNHYKNY